MTNDQVVLQPWTWVWTTPPNANGEGESVVADGVPPESPEVLTHDGSVMFAYPLPGWAFTARADLDGASSALTVVEEGDDLFVIDLDEVPDGAEIRLQGTANPGFYELNVSFAVQQRRDDPTASMTAQPSMVRAGDTFEVTFTGSLDAMRGGFFLLSGGDGQPVAMLWSDKFEGDGPGFDLAGGDAPVLDFAVITPGPDTLILPPDLDAGAYELCTRNSRPMACTTIEVTP